MNTLVCKACGGEMRKATQGDSASIGCIVSVFALIIGILLLLIPIIGWIIGGAFIIFALFRSIGKKRYIWKCRSCGSIIERAPNSTSSLAVILILSGLIILPFIIGHQLAKKQVTFTPLATAAQPPFPIPSATATLQPGGKARLKNEISLNLEYGIWKIPSGTLVGIQSIEAAEAVIIYRGEKGKVPLSQLQPE